MTKSKLISSIAAALIAASIFGGIDAQAAPHDTSIAIMATSVPVEEPSEETKEASDLKARVAQILNPEKDNVKVNGIKEGDLYVPKGTNIMLSLVDPLHSKRVKVGANFHLKTVDNLIINDVIVIPKDQEVTGKVIDAHKNGIFGGSGKLVINIPYVETRNGIQVPVNGYVSGYGNRDNGAIAVTAVVSVFGLFMKGTNIEYAPGQLFCVTVKEDTDLDATPENLKEVMSAERPHGQVLIVQAAK